MWQRLTLYDARVIGHYLGLLLIAFGVAMLVPFLTAVVMTEWQVASRYFLGVGVAVFVGSALRLLRIQPGKLDRQQALIVTGLAWIVLAFVATVPLYLSGHYMTYMDCLFDCVSGLTTTGVSIIVDLDHLSTADNMFRFVMHLIGGLGLIVVALSLGLFGKGAGASLYTSEARSEHVVPNVVDTAKLLARITFFVVIIASILIFVFCWVMGMDPARAGFHALWLSITGFVTGGFAPMSQSVAYYHSFPLEIVLMLLMTMGAVNFAVYAEVRRGQLKEFTKDLEIRTTVIWLIVIVIVITASLATMGIFDDAFALIRRGLFMVIAAFTTTGLQNITSDQLVTVFSSGAFFTLALVMAVGGGVGSTSGGIKLNRIGIIFKSAVADIKQAVSPDTARVSVSYNRIGRRVLTSEVAKEAMTIFVLYCATYFIGALVGVAYGHDAVSALFESIAMTSNGGLVTGNIVSPGMDVGLETFYILLMWAGRLEFLTFAALIVKIIVSFKPRPGKRAIEKRHAAFKEEMSKMMGEPSTEEANEPTAVVSENGKPGVMTVQKVKRGAKDVRFINLRK
ncbi:MAG: TrkH family potassium uptake protein [Eggerthellaceae bacterium]|nr:TrkH family potassium uptake protein [Eggerthellaceae bacterium]